MEIVKELHNNSPTDRCAVGYCQYNSGSMFVSNRDFLFVMGFTEAEDGTISCAIRSVTHDKYPEAKGFVRGKIISAGYRFVPTNAEKTEWDVTYFTILDLAGSIPSAIVNKVNKDQPTHLALLRDEIARAYKSKFN